MEQQAEYYVSTKNHPKEITSESKIQETNSLTLRGVWRIVEITSKEGKVVLDDLLLQEAFRKVSDERLSAFVTFPFDVEVGLPCQMFYVDRTGLCRTSTVEKIHYYVDEEGKADGTKSVQITTMNTQYVVERWQ